MFRDRKRIMVIGSGGSGKSTFSRELAQITGLPLIHLDRHHWRPGWVPTPREEWRQAVEQMAAADEWIIDGNYGGTIPIRIARCDVIVFFDFNRFTCVCGALKRRFWSKGPREDMADGCLERLDWSFLSWVWNYQSSSRPRVLEAIAAAPRHVEVITVRNRRDVRRLLSSAGPRPIVGVDIS